MTWCGRFADAAAKARHDDGCPMPIALPGTYFALVCVSEVDLQRNDSGSRMDQGRVLILINKINSVLL
jgi:hypothetical protein